MKTYRHYLRPALAIACLAFTQHASAIVDADNLGRWTKPTKIGPDKEVPGYLINLGPTGARAVLKESSFVVKHVFAESPANGQLKLEDEITGISGKKFAKHTFGKCYGMAYDVGYEGPIMDFGNAIEDSEGKDGTLNLDVMREGKPISVTLKLKAVGKFSDTFPQNCKKSDMLATQAIDYVLAHKDDHRGDVNERGMIGLALLARGKMEEAEKYAMAWNEMPDEKLYTWYPCYQSIFLSEYYLKSGDKRVLKTIKGLAERLYLSQVIDPSLYKDRMHGGVNQAANYLKGGNGHGYRIAGYGTMAITTLMTMLTWELAEDCGIEIDQTHVDLAYDCIHDNTNESGYMGYRNKTGAYSPVGRQGLCIIVHKVAGDRDSDKYLARVTSNLKDSKTRLTDGHADSVLGAIWGLLGIQLSGDEKATREFLDYNKAYINMSRTHDGAFVAQPGRNLYDFSYYSSPRMQLTSAMAIILGTAHPELRIQGKQK